MRHQRSMPSVKRSVCAASVDSMSKSCRLVRVDGRPSSGSHITAVSSPKPASTWRSSSLKAALTAPPTNQRTYGVSVSSRRLSHGCHCSIGKAGVASAAFQPFHVSAALHSQALLLALYQCNRDVATGVQMSAGLDWQTPQTRAYAARFGMYAAFVPPTLRSTPAYSF